MFCNNCGSPIPNGASNCPNCGNPINIQPNNINNNSFGQAPNNMYNNFPQQQMNFNGKPNNNNNLIIIGIIGAAVLVGIILMVFVFGTKTVTCTKSQNQTGLNLQVKMTTKFRNNKLNSLSMVFDSKLDDNYASYLDSYYDSMKEQFSTYENINGVKVNISKGTNNVSVKMDATKEGAEKVFDTTFSNSSNESPKSFIKAAEADGFTCNK